MEQILHFIGSTPGWAKFVIPYVLMAITVYSFSCWCVRSSWKVVKDSLKHSFFMYLFCLSTFTIVWLLLKWLGSGTKFIDWMVDNTFLSLLIYECLFMVGFFLYIIFSPSDSTIGKSTSAYRTHRPSTSRPAASRPTTSHFSTTPTETRPTAPAQRPRVVPVATPQKSKDPLGPVNMTNIENQLEKGISVRLDFEPNYARINRAVQLMKKSGAKITFYNLDKVMNYSNLIHTAKLAPGQIIYEQVFPANLNAIGLAESGACFTCDCKDHSTAIKDIAKAAKRGGGLVTFVNVSWMGTFEMKDLRESGGSHVEFK